MLCGLSVSPASTLSFVDWGASSPAAPVVSASVGAARAIPPVTERAIAIGSESLSFENIWISFVRAGKRPGGSCGILLCFLLAGPLDQPTPAGARRIRPEVAWRRRTPGTHRCPARLGRNG